MGSGGAAGGAGRTGMETALEALSSLRTDSGRPIGSLSQACDKRGRATGVIGVFNISDRGESAGEVTLWG